ncbi:DUF4113 domain-containing protein [Methylomonas lenta]|uniref:DUF4113 domain-containing protein n=1 Tax=Methylomonas lenta TaxID=980561 RepID=UPI0038B7BE44
MRLCRQWFTSAKPSLNENCRSHQPPFSKSIAITTADIDQIWKPRVGRVSQRYTTDVRELMCVRLNN